MLAAAGSWSRKLFDETTGLIGWCYPVLTYAALMRQECPSFCFFTALVAIPVRARAGRAATCGVRAA